MSPPASPRLASAARTALASWLLACAPAFADEPRPSPPPPAPPGAPGPAGPGAPVAQGGGEDQGRRDGIDAPGPAPARRVGPVVRSANEAADQLRAPGDDPYGGSIDWRHVPPWQQTSFFGIRARGTFFVFVVDCSGSMADDLRLYRAKQELRRCIDALRSPQRYLVLFYNDRMVPMPGSAPRSADRGGKRDTFSWLQSVEAAGGTDPRGAMDFAIGLAPDAVFLIADGEFPRGTERAIASRNRDRIPIHCINLGGGLGEAQLRAIAEQSGGRYTSRQ